MKRQKAKAFIDAIKTMRDSATDEQALDAMHMYPTWREGQDYAVGDRVLHDNHLHTCLQAHTSQADWQPGVAVSLWVVISLEEGTVDSPIEAVSGMEYTVGKHYLDPSDGKIYICTRGEVLHYLPHELVGIYFEEVSA